MFREKSVTVVVPAYNEEQTITDVVSEFLAEECVDRVLVVHNNSKDATAELARAAGAEVLEESAPGYGCAIRAGLDHCAQDGTDVCVITEAENLILSFRDHDEFPQK